MSYVLSVIRPPVPPAAFGKAVVLDPVPYHATAAKRQARYVLETEGGASRAASHAFVTKLVLAENGTLLTHDPSGLAFRIDHADTPPNVCPCCGRLVAPEDALFAGEKDTHCDGCYPLLTEYAGPACLPANTAHTEEP